MVVLGLALSLVIGISLGLLGGGGSTLTVPVIHYVFGVETHQAIALSLVVVGATSLVALIPHARAGRVQWKLGLAFGLACMVSAFFGGKLGAALPGRFLIDAFAVLMVAAGIAMLRRAHGPLAACRPENVSLRSVLLIGVGVGLITGTLGAGGGFIIVPALTLAGGIAIREAVGTSLLVIAMNSAAGFAGTASEVHLDMRLLIAVTVVAVAGTFFGARLGRRLSPQHLQRAFGWFVIIVGLVMIIRDLA
ncbi:MAG TPA: sulfite exporter TauE/SafE family protein [Kofleriaceae bacterium]|nr:sulfite exporter TauE/SafE family protein [Kofleriaceae bacterium]